MNETSKLVLLSAAFVCVSAVVASQVNFAQRGGGNYASSGKEDPKPLPVPAPAPAPTIPALKLYEWGVATGTWDGTPEAEDVPAFYYDCDEIPVLAPKPQPVPMPRPQPDPDPRPDQPKPRKPVIYFEADRSVTFDLDITFRAGEVTWMYPKPNRRLSAGTVQWDNIVFHPDAGLTATLPELAKAEQGHWSEYSRLGATGSIVVNGECERFLFYEGTQTGLPEMDIFRDARGVVVRNYTAHAFLDLRVQVTVDGTLRKWRVREVPAATGEVPGEVVLDVNQAVDKVVDEAALKDETRKAGLTEAQAGVFARCWTADFSQAESVSWRRSPAALDDLMELKLTLPPGLGSEIRRVGYVRISHVNLAKQAEIEALVAKAAADDKQALSQLKNPAGQNAARRAASDSSRPLKERLKLAKVLASLSE